MRGSIESIETLGLVDGPGVRIVVFLKGCKLRCKYCHNPEMWEKGEDNYDVNQLVSIIRRFQPYFKDAGGITFSGGEPLLQSEFLIEVVQLLKKEDIHVAIDTSGVSKNGNYIELLKLVDLVILDVKHIDEIGYKDLTGQVISKSLEFIDYCNKLNKKMWIRQVIIPEINDNMEYIIGLKNFVKRFDNLEKIEFLPYHRLGIEKYKKLGIEYPYIEKKEMSKEKCEELFNEFMKLDNN